MIEASAAWREMYSQAAIGILALDRVENPSSHAGLDQRKEALESELRARFAAYGRQDLAALPSVEPYNAYYKRFKKTYHVLQQLESVVHKGKPIPRTAALVEAMFMAELKNQLLTAGHDLDLLQEPVSVTVARGDETYTGIDGRNLQTRPGDMMIADAEGILSSIIYGPDRRTRITPDTRRVLFTVYAPAGVPRQLLADHLGDLLAFVKIIALEAQVLEERVID